MEMNTKSSSPLNTGVSRISKVEPVNGNNKPKTLQPRDASTLLHKEKNDLTISEEVIVKELEKANKALTGINKRFEYSVHEKTGDIMVKVIDQDTNEVVRELPPEKILDLVAKLQEISGILIDEKR